MTLSNCIGCGNSSIHRISVTPWWLHAQRPAPWHWGQEAAVVAAVGMAFADRQLWGKARKLLEQSAAASALPHGHRRKAWLALAQMARQGNDESRAQACERAAAEVA